MINTENEEIKWYLRPTIVVVLIFFVLGPFALPLLYKSPKFNLAWKIILTFLVIIYTAYLIFLTAQTLRRIAAMTQEFQDLLMRQLN